MKGIGQVSCLLSFALVTQSTNIKQHRLQHLENLRSLPVAKIESGDVGIGLHITDSFGAPRCCAQCHGREEGDLFLLSQGSRPGLPYAAPRMRGWVP